MIRTLRLLPFLLLCLAAAPARAQPPVWVVHGPHSTLVLFGSVHLLPPGLDWEPPALKTALKSADDLWFEVPFDDAAALAAAQYATRMGLLPDGESLSEMLKPRDRARLAKSAQKFNLPMDAVDRLRPWYADLTLSVAADRQYGVVKENGVEETLSASGGATPRRAFETIPQQISFLAGASRTDQIASLLQTLDEIEAGPAAYQRLLKAWMNSDTAAIQHEALDPLIKQAPGVYRKLVVERNRRWLALINARLGQKGQAVMVVGVGHLIGPDSVPALLRAEGVRVDGP